ncbi:MAG: SGNH/GDSL hydrolase family protein [Desulfomonilaceae bacterium]
MTSVTFLSLPIVLTASLFLILYNNTYNGRLILFIVLLFNTSILLIPVKRSLFKSALPWARLSSLCLIGGIAAILALDVLFPLVLPREYNQIMDLSKSFMPSVSSLAATESVVFNNSDQKMRNSANTAPSKESRFKVWHAPGREFTYYGYDPNSKTSYINRFHWNSDGYFDNDYDYRRPEGVHRIVVVGDSFVEAVQVPLARTFHKLIEADLNATPGGAEIRPKIEVIALGNSGTGQLEHFKVLRDRAILYHPDVVAIGFGSYDFCRDDPKLKEELVLAAGGITPPIRRLVCHGYMALAFALRRIEDIQRNRIGVSPDLLQWADSNTPRIEAAWSRTMETVRAEKNFCHARGITFLLIYLGSDLEVKYAIDPDGTIARLKAMGPLYQEIAWDMNRSLSRVASFCEENGIILISLLEPLVTAQRETGKNVFGDHYTMFGHEVAAQVLARAVGFRLQAHLAGAPAVERSAASSGSLLKAPDGSTVKPAAADHNLDRPH